MPEDYLAKSGARELLATAVAEVLALRPRVPVAFLACHFQGVAASPTTAVAAALRACHPSSASFVCAVEQGFHDLAAVASAASDKPLPLPRPATAPRSGAVPPRPVALNPPAVVAEATFRRLLLQLSVDFPAALQTRLVRALVPETDDITAKDGANAPGVGLTRFQRGVQACLLLEELLDAAAALTQALDGTQERDGSGCRETATATLRSAATSQFPRDAATVLLPLLHEPTTTAEGVESGDDVQELLLELVFRA